MIKHSNLLRGAISGLFAGLILAMFDFLDPGSPGGPLFSVVHWFGLVIPDPATNRIVGFLILIVLGALFGLLFGLLVGKRDVSFSRAVLIGLALGVALWLIFDYLLGNIIRPIFPYHFNFFDIVYFLVRYLVYGLLMGVLYFQIGVWRRIGDMRQEDLE